MIWMFGFIKNKFLFIVMICVITLVVLVVGAFSLYQDHSFVFDGEGYIIETTSKTNQKYYFSANTKYKENVDDKIAFSDTESNSVAVDPASFVHYLNGDVSFLKKGAIVDLGEINSPMINYYNITNQNKITYEDDHYVVTSNGKKISIDSFIGRINDQKYLVAGSNLTLKVPNVAEMISGDYFEILFIEEGIVKIDNQEASYQVTAQDTYLYIGNNITISLGDGKIFYDGDAKMLLSQITINGDENIDLDVPKNNGAGGGTGSGTGDGTGSGDGEGNLENGDLDGTGDGENSGTGSGTGVGESADGDATTNSPQIELIEANVTSTVIDLTLQMNNVGSATGPILYYLTNVSTGKREYANLEMVNGTFQIRKESLSPSTEYVLSIVEADGSSEKQYFQKTFKTKDLGINLEKVYATDSSLSYRVVFDENTDVTRARVTIYDNNGNNDQISNSQYTISKDDLNQEFVFEGLKSDTRYSVSVDMVWINNAAYSDVYSINRIDSTLKKTPTITGVDVDTNAEEVKFTIQLKEVKDPDKAIISYTYNIYLADDINLDNPNPMVQYSVTKNDSDALILNLNEIDELKTGVDYRCRIVAQYQDNEMVREVETDYSNNFLIRSKPNISFTLEQATMNRVVGTIQLIDANCTVPISGRSCFSEGNNFVLRYYKVKDEETTENDTSISFNPNNLTSQITLSDLSSNTTYAVKVFGNYYDDDQVLHPNVQIGDTFYVNTDKSDNLHFEVVGDNTSGKNHDGSDNSANVVTFDARLTAPQDSDIMNEISTITLNLYSGRYNVSDKLIGTYRMTTRSEIEDFFSNITILNSLFDDTTKFRVGKLDSLEKLIQVTNNSTGTLNSSYTVEVENVYDSTGHNKIVVEDNVYTFNLTPAYYLDARIETNPDENYITTTLIKKENLTDDEYETLNKDVKNLDLLNDDTIVGLKIENSLSDIFVDSAFTYEKVFVDFTIYNVTTKQEVKTIRLDMQNKYQPKMQIIYLDSSELDDGKTHFTRGYQYRVGYHLSFITEDGSNPIYMNDRLYKNLTIERQDPIYTQYISTSGDSSVTYRYRFQDVDHALYDHNFYYTLGEEEEEYLNVKDGIVVDGEYHEVEVPIDQNVHYKVYYARKNTSNKITYVSIHEYDFEKEFQYGKETAYEIVDDHDNVLKLRLKNLDVTSRAMVYKVVIHCEDDSKITDYTKYFLASKLATVSIDEGNHDEEGNEVLTDYRYIAIDYANISKFMGHNMKISVFSYYDSGLVGIDQKFTNGMVLWNEVQNKYLNVYNSGSSTVSSSNTDVDNMGMYLLKEDYHQGDDMIVIYNHLMDTNRYNPLLGASFYSTDHLADNIGISFQLSYSNAGITFVDGKKEYIGYNARVLKEAELQSDKNTYRFDTIVPTVEVTTSKNTINSIKVDIQANGIYGNRQFLKDGQPHPKIYIDFYQNEDLSDESKQMVADVNISGNDDTGYSATVESVEYGNLIPDTIYYFTVSAYIDGKLVQLYDHSSSTSSNRYVAKTYSSKTLNAREIMNSIKFSVVPKKYNGESSLKELSWRLGLKSTENYKIRFELYRPNGSHNEQINDEEVSVPDYKLVQFDGRDGVSCDPNVVGKSDANYISNCYISVDRKDVSSISNKENTYQFTGDHFVFGGSYYKLIVYAVPYTNDHYDEEHKVILYQNDSLSTTGRVTESGFTYDITIPMLEAPEFSLNNTLVAGHTESDGYYISFIPTIVDNSYAIKYGTYTIRLLNEKEIEVQRKNSVSVSVNQEIKFNHLDSNTLYYVELSYDTYRNNVNYTEDEKDDVTPFKDFIYTPINAGITLGTITAGQSNSQSVTLTYNGSSNLSENITKVTYTISLKGGSSRTTGTYEVVDGKNIFTVASDRIPRLVIDTSDSNYSSNPSFRFQKGNTYIITTQYYYGNDQLLEDQETGNSTHTTILNL